MKKILIFLLLILFLLATSGCTEKCYDSYEEILNFKYSENIEDLDFCNIVVINKNSTNFNFNFIGLNDKTECEYIKKECDRYNNCQWRVEGGAESTKIGCWKPKWTATCVCRGD